MTEAKPHRPVLLKYETHFFGHRIWPFSVGLDATRYDPRPVRDGALAEFPLT